MDVRESPTVRHWPPGPVGLDGDKYGQFVILSIDLAASVAILEDDAALQSALQLPNDRYLAYVLTTGSTLIEADDGWFKLTLQFYLVCRGLPIDHPNESVPIAPTTYHPLGREPVHPTSPLPWDNLYISTTSSIEALVSRIHYGRGPHPARMPRAARNAVFTITFEDLEKARQSTVPVAVPRPVQQQRPPEPTRDDDEYSTDPGSGTTSTDSSSRHSEPTFLGLAMRSIYAKSLGAEKFVELWLDIEDACPDPDSLGAPDRLNLVSRQLFFIWKDWETQAVADLLSKRPHTER
ncbi:hypothetical protein EXIGLDRAFT_703091 [Exidia glandulosa HHB12029]|uniref:Uncharacterized protein n=1 Tax=Exidia glandulosa HHB12029 TaxID=1314781 RepID=A0A165C7Q6_EXIGL|nr:hypothetical protein EXIGLDRAFT_703091 [Exidia glandulosa HHB12029]